MDSNVNVGTSRGATDGNPSEAVLQDFTELLKPAAEDLRATGGSTSQPEMPMESPCLNMGLGLASKKDEETPDSNDGLKYSPVSYRSRQRNTFARRNETPPRPESNDLRIARPPGEGRGRNQLLPRYWPRITDREIQQITPGDSNSVITPLFEKVLSASDAGRIGRLVLPKACAEAYFPQISQPEGLPLRINDMNGREWQFQFRFWPNNNSRMYVLEGVTPCIQAMQLQAGDTVTFSRLEPEGKLIMGFRRSSAIQESVGDDVASLNGKYQSGSDYKAAKSREAQSLLSDKRRGRPLGAKSKRLRLETEESLEIKSSWEEAQELLRPPPGVTPSFVTIDGHQFEEYEEPPVLAKKTLTRTKPSGEQERWVQCDACTQYRKVPFEVFLHTQWTCSDNVWDSKRAHCSAPRELTNDEIDQLLSLNNRTVSSVKQEDRPGKVDESSGLDALASAAAIGNDAPGSPPPPAATTRHPRHRPGCTCIVCIQPPSGKGPKHKPSCVCNVCLTVKRRFKTLMMRRKKRQSEREAENAARKKSKPWDKEEPPAAAELSSSSSKWGSYQVEAGGTRQERSSRKTFPFPPAPGLLSTPFQLAVEGQQQHPQQMPIDLNCHPDREEGTRISMLRLLQDASLPLDLYMKQQGLASLQQRQQRRDQEQQREQQQQQLLLQVDQQQQQTEKQIQPNVSSA